MRFEMHVLCSPGSLMAKGKKNREKGGRIGRRWTSGKSGIERWEKPRVCS